MKASGEKEPPGGGTPTGGAASDTALLGSPVVRPGATCWRTGHADRLAVIIDARAYFAAVRAAIIEARHSVMLIGWDFDTRVTLDHDAKDGAPVKLGRFLSWVAKRRPDLHIYMLKWDIGFVATLGRGSTPITILNWISSKNIRFKLDSAHPSMAAHHQKIVVIDDVLAFCGGIDITADRWDTRQHLDEDPHRVRPMTKRRYGPWHDATAAVAGEVARALGDLARERWKRATGKEIEPPPPAPAIWPPQIEEGFRDVPVGIARTLPKYKDQSEVREIEALYLAAIAAAKRAIYMESQYFASRRIAEALASRLREASGPQVVVVNPESAGGWLEEEVMGSARARLLRMVGDADAYGRFRIYTPVTGSGEPIYVHAKIMIVDDWLLRLGSSNLNNRSMGYDTECDLVLEVREDTPEAERARLRIAALRSDLLAEHLGRTTGEVDEAIATRGSLIAGIEALRSSGRSLRPFVPPEINAVEHQLAECDLLDPEGVARPFPSTAKKLAALMPGGIARALSRSS